MSRDYLESLFKELHKGELERMDKLDGQVNFPAVVVTGLAGVGAFYLQNFPDLDKNVWSILFFVSLTLYLLFLLGAVYYLVRSYFRHKYRAMATPDAIAEFADGLRDSYRQTLGDKPEAEQEAKVEVQEFLIQQYKECSAQNRDRNSERSAYLYRSTSCIVASLAAFLISIPPFYALSLSKPKIQKVEITSLPEKQRLAVTMPELSKVEVSGGLSPQKVESITPKKGRN